MPTKESFELVAVEVAPIYHPEGWGIVDDALEKAVELSATTNKSLKVCWNGTLADVKPGMTTQDAFTVWHEARESYQKNSPAYHPALCTVCADKPFKLAR